MVVAGWRYTLAVTWVRRNEKPADVLERLWQQVTASKIVCQKALLDRYFFTVPVMQWLKKHGVPFIIPVVMRGPKPKRGKKPKGLRAYCGSKAGSYDYTHRAGSESVDFRLVINYKTGRNGKTKKREVKKMFFATWKVRLTPTQVRDAYRGRFGIETSYRQLNQSRARTSSRDPLYRFLLVGLALFLRNLWQWLATDAGSPGARGGKNRGAAAKSTRPPRYRDVMDEFGEYLGRRTQPPIATEPVS